jgi:hypothetical protein
MIDDTTVLDRALQILEEESKLEQSARAAQSVQA